MKYIYDQKPQLPLYKLYCLYKHLDQLKNLDVGSAVVHEIHGIGRYGGLKQITVNDNANEYLTII